MAPAGVPGHGKEVVLTDGSTTSLRTPWATGWDFSSRYKSSGGEPCQAGLSNSRECPSCRTASSLWATPHRKRMSRRDRRLQTSGVCSSLVQSKGKEIVYMVPVPLDSEFIIHNSRLTPFLSSTHRENRITSLFSCTHWEHFFCPFVFNQLLGAIFIFNIFLCWVISRLRR